MHGGWMNREIAGRVAEQRKHVAVTGSVEEELPPERW
jgi:hypothetical protein